MKAIVSLVFIAITFFAQSQLIPSAGENIDFLTTFSKNSNPSWGDDDNTQVFFFLIPKSFKESVYIRVFDPNIGGQHDQIAGGKFNSRTIFSFYGGEGVHSESDARKENPVGAFQKGNLLASKTFSSEKKYDNMWYTFGPFNPVEGEYNEQFGGYIFKVVCKGLNGNDGNLYRYFLSTSDAENIPVEGSNGFTYEYCFRLKRKPSAIAHLYPFIDEKVISIEQFNFDLDADGKIELYSVDKNGVTAQASGNNEWANSKHLVTESEKGGSIDYQIIKNTKDGNDMVVYLLNQYKEPVPFFSNPIGGPPKYKYKINIKYKNK